MSKTIIRFFALVAAVSTSLAIAAPSTGQWLSQIGGKGAEVVFGLTETSDGRLCAAGTFWSSALFGSGNNSVKLATPAAQDMFVACYEAEGRLTFARRFGTQRGDEPRAIAALPDGDVVVAGLFSHDLGLAGDPVLAAAGNADIFVLRLNAAGDTVWSRQFGGGLADSGNALAVTPDGDILLAGNFAGLMTYRSGGKGPKLNGAGARDAVVMKLAANGDVLWAQRAGGGGFDEATAVAAARDGSVLVAGTFRNDALIGDTTLTSRGFRDVFLLALDADGGPQWTAHMGGTGQDEVRGLATDALGRIHVAGNFQRTIFFPGGETIETSGGTDVFLARFGNDGSLQRSSGFGGLLTDQVFGVAAGRDGGLWVSGHYQGNTDVAPGSEVVRLTAPSPGNSGGFVVLLDRAGNYAWSGVIGGSGMEMVLAVTALSEGGAALAGLYNEDLTMADAGTLGNRGKTDVFIARFGQPVVPRVAGSSFGNATQFDW